MTELRVEDWFPQNAREAMQNAPKNQKWIEEAAYYHFLHRERNHISGDWHDDRKAALRQLDDLVEQVFLQLFLNKAEPKIRIRCSVISYTALFSNHKPSEIFDDMPLAGLPFFDDGLGLTCVIPSICKVAKVAEMSVPQGVSTVGGLIIALQTEYQVRCARPRRRRARKSRRK